MMNAFVHWFMWVYGELDLRENRAGGFISSVLFQFNGMAPVEVLFHPKQGNISRLCLCFCVSVCVCFLQLYIRAF